MSAKASLRVHFVHHEGGKLMGSLLRAWAFFFEAPPPSAFGEDEDDVLAQLDVLLAAALAGGDLLERYLWDESFAAETVAVDVHPQALVRKRPVIGKKTVRLRLLVLAGRIHEDGERAERGPGAPAASVHRVLVPRFGFSFVVEDLKTVRDVLGQIVGSMLLGEDPRSVYDLRQPATEYVRAWSPKQLEPAKRAVSSEDSSDPRPNVEAVADDLVALAAQGKAGAPVADPDDAALDEVFAIVSNPRAPSVLLVGPSGVGKSTLVRRLARKIVVARRQARDDGTEDELNLPKIWSTSEGRILAGMVYLGMWQERCLAIARELERTGEYLYVDRLGSLIKPQSDGTSIAEIFGPAMRDGSLALIAECTEVELEEASARASSFVSAFEVVRVAEPTGARLLALLAEYERKRGLEGRLHAAGRRRLVQHLATLRPDTAFPGKATRFVDWLANEAGFKAKGPRVLYARDASEAYARYANLPVELIADEHAATEAGTAAKLEKLVIGQPAACAATARVVARFKAGLADPERPLGVLLFVGPTGVGKTELAKALARTMFGTEQRLVRLDMSEYMVPGSSARLLATGTGTSLVERVRQDPYCVVLVDEVEKAHPEVFDLLLGLLGEGRLTDDEGRRTDFRMTVVLLTSNLGAGGAAPVGFGEAAAPNFARRVREHFRPEFVGRIDHVVPFSHLSKADLLRIVDLELDKALARPGLVRRKLDVRVDTSARERLAELGYHPARGARALRRVVEERVIAPLAARIAADPTVHGLRVDVTARAGEIVLG